MARWDPWRGCKRYSEGCKFCYIHKGDLKRGVTTENIVRLDGFDRPILKDKKGEYKMKSGQLVYVCFASDFLIEDADEWRRDAWKIIKERADLRFMFLTKRITRIEKCLPPDWGDGYDNVIIGCTVENQRAADERLPVFASVPIKHRNIDCQPMLERMDIEKYLSGVEYVIVGGESDKEARPLSYEWVLDIRSQCERAGTHFSFRQCGTHFIKDGEEYTLPVRLLCAQARKAGIDL